MRLGWPACFDFSPGPVSAKAGRRSGKTTYIPTYRHENDVLVQFPTLWASRHIVLLANACELEQKLEAGRWHDKHAAICCIYSIVADTIFNFQGDGGGGVPLRIG